MAVVMYFMSRERLARRPMSGPSQIRLTLPAAGRHQTGVSSRRRGEADAWPRDLRDNFFGFARAWFVTWVNLLTAFFSFWRGGVCRCRSLPGVAAGARALPDRHLVTPSSAGCPTKRAQPSIVKARGRTHIW